MIGMVLRDWEIATKKEDVLAVCHQKTEEYMQVVEQQLRKIAGLTRKGLSPRLSSNVNPPEG